ncbi:hypothetical protein [Vibrio paucivorans]
MPLQNSSGLKLKVKPIHEEPLFKEMASLGALYVHGTNSNFLEGLIKYRAFLSMEDIDRTAWFHRDGGLKSGERGYTIECLYKSQPISMGVSLHYIQNYKDCLSYSRHSIENAYPILIGFDKYVPISEKIRDHPVSIGSIGLDRVVVVYVPFEKLFETKKRLEHMPTLSSKVRPFV